VKLVNVDQSLMSQTVRTGRVVGCSFDYSILSCSCRTNQY